RRSDTKVDAVAERQVIVRLTRDVELLRLGEFRRVAIGRAEDHCDYRPRLDSSAAHFRVALREAQQHLYWTVIAQHLLYRRRDQRRIAPQSLILSRIAREREQAVAYQIGGRLVACYQQQHHECEQFFAAERPVVVARS